jgi:hypothetical protein
MVCSAPDTELYTPRYYCLSAVRPAVGFTIMLLMSASHPSHGGCGGAGGGEGGELEVAGRG